jgi:hypothetical protein
MQHEIPSILLYEALKTIRHTASSKTAPTDVCVDNVKLTFSCGKIFTVALKSVAQFSSYVEWDDIPLELENQSFAIPYEEAVKILSGNLEKMHTYLDIGEKNNRILFKSGKTEIRFQLEGAELFPREIEPSMEILWSIQGDDFKRLLASRVLADPSPLNDNFEKVFIYCWDGKLNSCVFGYNHITIISKEATGKLNKGIVFIPSFSAKSALDGVKDDQDVYICRDDRTTISCLNWSLTVNQMDAKIDLDFIYNGIRNIKSSTLFATTVTTKSKLHKSLSMYNTVGYETIGEALEKRIVKMTVKNDGLVLTNELSSYGIHATIEVEGDCSGEAEIRVSYGILSRAISLASEKVFISFYHKALVVLTDQSETLIIAIQQQQQQ